MTSELAYEASDEASENELLDRSLSVWRGWSAIEWEDFTPIALDIHTACSIGQYDWVRSLIARNDGLALDRKNHGGWTPLMYACYIGHDNVVNLLINAGCQMNLKNPRGHTPLMLAASCGNETVARTLIRNGAELELTDKCGWTALFHATYAGHQNFVAFLLETGANKDAVEPITGMTPFMEAAAEGHEIIVQLFLQNGVNVNAKAYNGDMARSLALINGYMKIVSLIDNHVLPFSSLRSEPGLDFYLSSSDDGQLKPRRANVRQGRGKSKGPSIRDGPEAIARMIDRTRNTDMADYATPAVPKGYVTFSAAGDIKSAGTQLSHRDVTSPINPDDYKDNNSGTEDFDDYNDESNAFTKTGAITIKSSSSSSGGLIAALGLSREGSIDSDDSHSVELTNSASDPNVRNVRDSEQVAKSYGDETTTVSGCLEPFESVENDYQHQPDSMAKKCGNIAIVKASPEDVNAIGKEREKPWAIVSPLRDYFPMEIPFQVSFAEAPTQNVSQMAVSVSSSRPHGATQSLPVENMSQAEIVSRYLNNLNLNPASPTPIKVDEPGHPSQQASGNEFHPQGGNSGIETNVHDLPPPSSLNENSVSILNVHGNEPMSPNAFVHEIARRNTARGEGVEVPNSFLPTENQGQPVPNSDASNRNQISVISPDQAQDHPIVQMPSTILPQNNIGSSAITNLTSSPQSGQPYVHHHPLHPSYLLPTSLHHHHHHFHTSQQSQNVHDIFSSAPPLDHQQFHQQRHYELRSGQDHFLPGAPGFYNLQQHLMDTRPGSVHPFLQTVPPELYYRDIDASPQLHPAPATAHPLNTNNCEPSFCSENMSFPEPISIYAPSSTPRNVNKVDKPKSCNVNSAVDHDAPAGNIMVKKPENSCSKSASDRFVNHVDWPLDPQVAGANPVSCLASALGDYTPEGNFMTNLQQPTACSQTSVTPNPGNSELGPNRRQEPYSNPSHDGPLADRSGNKNLQPHPSNTAQFVDRAKAKTMAATLGINRQGMQVASHHHQPDQVVPLLQAEPNGKTDAGFRNQSVPAASVSSNPPSVMIPGHATSQPISQSVAWLNQNDRVGGGPLDLQDLLAQLGLTKYLDKFEEQDVDLAVFLSLTDNDLKELGIKLFGPRKKMTNAIARWHSNAPVSCSELEQAYADRLEGEMQEMAIQLNQACANEESLKAQVLQEQQLRSVTEGCLMEMRMSWCQARQLVQDARGTLRTMGELVSRLRHNHKELKKTFVDSRKERSQSTDKAKDIGTSVTDASMISRLEQKEPNNSPEGGNNGGAKNVSHGSKDGSVKRSFGSQGDTDSSPNCSLGDGPGLKSTAKDQTATAGPDILAAELLKKSEKCMKDMHQALNSLLHNMDHILKSTQNMNMKEMA